MATMEKTSCARYREVVFQTPEFNPYFIQATPGQELGSLNIGSRPSKRKSNAGVGALRAIPWIFAWTQSRFHLPVWLGMFEAFQEMKALGKMDTLRAMYAKWPFFKVTMDLIEMVLAKADPAVAAYYEKELVDPSLFEFGARLRASLAHTTAIVLEITAHSDLLTPQIESGGQGTYSTLADKLAMRSLYITPLNIVQVENLKLLREIELGNAKPDWVPQKEWAKEMLARYQTNDLYHAVVSDTLIITMKGIAAGMQNTG
jgi:phosphoenolpyruvate carboxylase